jgi:hypothetical protein
MTWLPGWNSPDSVATYRTIFEASSITLLLLGSAFGVFAFLYNHRQSEMDRTDKQAMQLLVTAANDGASHANAEAKRLETALEAERQGRLLSPEKLMILTQHLRNVLNPKAKIDLSGIEGDREAMRLAEQLAPVFRDAGFTVNDQAYETSVIGGVGKGVVIRQESKEGPIGVRIAAAFTAVGIESRIIEMGANRLGADNVEVIVGRRP